MSSTKIKAYLIAWLFLILKQTQNQSKQYGKNDKIQLAFPDLQYVSADAFLCEEDAAPEQVFSSIKKLFKPEKTKTTILKRGDFGTNTDMKPKTKTKVAPLRRIHNTGSKVINMLKNKDDNKNW